MYTLSKFTLAAGLLLTAIGFQPAAAQSTDGYHTIQIFPVVVDSTSFTQRFVFKNPNNAEVTIQPQFYPGTGTAQSSVVNCPTITVPASRTTVVVSLRAMCPAMVAGSAFGYLYTYETHTANLPYSGFSRVSNAAGSGFSVEAFPAHTFTSARSVVTGARRLTATANSPAYQTNCFIGNLNDRTPAAVPATTTVEYGVYDSAGDFVKDSTVTLVPGKLTRLLDVFAAVGLPTGNIEDATIAFREIGPDEPGLMTFCTVQDNTSFGADFRIAKQEIGDFGWLGGQDGHVQRNSTENADVWMSGSVAPRPFTIAAGSHNSTHVMYFRHPDWVSCELVETATGLRLPASYGLEMRMLDDAATPIAGGDTVTGFQSFYLGDKSDSAEGANTRYTIEVESGGNIGVARPYGLHCQSGSGHTRGDVVRYQEPFDKF